MHGTEGLTMAPQLVFEAGRGRGRKRGNLLSSMLEQLLYRCTAGCREEGSLVAQR